MKWPSNFSAPLWGSLLTSLLQGAAEPQCEPGKAAGAQRNHRFSGALGETLIIVLGYGRAGGPPFRSRAANPQMGNAQSNRKN